MNNFKAENAKLVDATAYQDKNETWYLELQYEYEDESGVHRRYYPKVEFPFFCGKLLQKEFTNSLGILRNALQMDGLNSARKLCAQYARKRTKDLSMK